MAGSLGVYPTRQAHLSTCSVRRPLGGVACASTRLSARYP